MYAYIAWSLCIKRRQSDIILLQWRDKSIKSPGVSYTQARLRLSKMICAGIGSMAFDACCCFCPPRYWSKRRNIVEASALCKTLRFVGGRGKCVHASAQLAKRSDAGAACIMNKKHESERESRPRSNGRVSWLTFFRSSVGKARSVFCCRASSRSLRGGRRRKP